MTTFTDRVAACVGPAPSIPPYPRTQPAEPVASDVGLARQRLFFAEATILAAQANAVLRERDEPVQVLIEGAAGDPGFDIRVGSAHSRVVTTVNVDDQAFSRLLGDGLNRTGARELVGPAELARLILLLVSSRYREARTGIAA